MPQKLLFQSFFFCVDEKEENDDDAGVHNRPN